MSTNRTDYIIYGWKLPYNNGLDYNDQSIWPWIDGYKPCRLITDEMAGEYAVFGQVLYSQNGDNNNGWEFQNIENMNCSAYLTRRCFSDLFGKAPDTLPKLFIFTDFS